MKIHIFISSSGGSDSRPAFHSLQPSVILCHFVASMVHFCINFVNFFRYLLLLIPFAFEGLAIIPSHHSQPVVCCFEHISVQFLFCHLSYFLWSSSSHFPRLSSGALSSLNSSLLKMPNPSQTMSSKIIVNIFDICSFY